ncbi:Uncharacterised protein [Streptococcus pneumoniae]|nr:Uncharacterised protein [Streptococcus pneumoniae]
MNQIIGAEIERRGLRTRALGMTADLAARHCMRGEETEGEHAEADDNAGQPGRCAEPDAEQHERHAAAQNLPRTEARHQTARPAGTENAAKIDDEQQTDERGRQAEWRAGQAEANVVEQRDEAPHQQEALQEQAAQDRVRQVQAEIGQQDRQRERLRLEVARRRQQPDEQAQGHHSQRGDTAERQRPAAQITQQAGQQTPEHPTQSSAADVQPHRRRQRVRVELFTDIGHRQRRQATQRQAQQRAQ